MSKRKASFDSNGSSQQSTARRKASFDISSFASNDPDRKSSFDLSHIAELTGSSSVTNLEDHIASSSHHQLSTSSSDPIATAFLAAANAKIGSDGNHSSSAADEQLLLEALGDINGNRRSRSNTMDTTFSLSLLDRSRSNTMDTLNALGLQQLRSRSNTLDTLGSALNFRSRSNSLVGIGESYRHRSNSLDELVIAASALQHTGIIDDITAAAAGVAQKHGMPDNLNKGNTNAARPRATSTSSPLLSASASLADDMSTNSFLLHSNDMQKMVQTAVAACADIDVNSSINSAAQSGTKGSEQSGALESTVAALAASTSNIHEINYDEIASMAVPLIPITGNNAKVPTEICVKRSKTPVHKNTTAKKHTPKDQWRAREEKHSNDQSNMTAVPLSSNMSSYPIVSASARTLPKSKSSRAASRSTSDAAPCEKGQSNQKWEEMFECLKQYVAEKRKQDEAKGLNMENWSWEGNVATNYKTKEGKALGRWVNNQRSAKNKGTLRKEREERLVDAGLKWSVLSTNAWPDMMKELTRYVKEKTKDGKKWDGNVPTNYKIKYSPDGTEYVEEKNLGRWINRQRSLFQANRLRKDRQLELEALGLKWSVLATTSWESMFAALQTYVDEVRDSHPKKIWDGNVPAAYKTKCQKNLGRWVNRQRLAYAKQKLKKEYVEQLESLGLKWVVAVESRKNDDEVRRQPDVPKATAPIPSTVNPFALNSINTPGGLKMNLPLPHPAAIFSAVVKQGMTNLPAALAAASASGTTSEQAQNYLSSLSILAANPLTSNLTSLSDSAPTLVTSGTKVEQLTQQRTKVSAVEHTHKATGSVKGDEKEMKKASF